MSLSVAVRVWGDRAWGLRVLGLESRVQRLEELRGFSSPKVPWTTVLLNRAGVRIHLRVGAGKV